MVSVSCSFFLKGLLQHADLRALLIPRIGCTVSAVTNISALAFHLLLSFVQSRTAAQRTKISELTRVLSGSGQTEAVIVALLEDAGWNVEAAANLYYDSGVPARVRAKGGAGGSAVSAAEIMKEFTRLAPAGKMDDAGITKFAG